MRQRRGRIVPLGLAVGMLLIVVAAGLAPNGGVVQAQSSCTYGQCPAAATFPLWAVSASVGAVVVALLAALLLLRRRRRRPPPAEPETPSWSEGTSDAYAQPTDESSVYQEP